MSLRNAIISNETRLAVVRAIIAKQHAAVRRGDQDARVRLSVMKSIARELQMRMEQPPTSALGVIQMQLGRITEIKGSHTSDPEKLSALAVLIIQHWPMIRIAIETYREPINEPSSDPGICP